MKNYKLSYNITIPVFNEEKRLPMGVSTLYQFLESIGLQNFTITIVDNGSIDNTEKIAKDLISPYPKVRFLSVTKKGVGLALKTAWDQSQADIIGVMDVDLATNIEHFQEVANIFESGSNEIVNASRILPASVVVNRSFLRTFLSLGLNKMLRLFLGAHFTDGQCGFKFLRQDTYLDLRKTGLSNDGWFFFTELLYVAEKTNLSIREIPVTWLDDRDSRVKIIQTVAYYLKEIFKLRIRKFEGLGK